MIQIEGILYKLRESDSVAECDLRDNIGCMHCYISCDLLDRDNKSFSFVLKEVE